MKVCLIVEGAYPYVTGGVSSWVQGLMLSMPDVEFVVQTIAASPDERQQFKYKIPSNVSEIQEVYLLDDDYVDNRTQKKVSLTGEEYDAFENLLFESSPDWSVIIRFFAEKDVSLNALLSGKDFLRCPLTITMPISGESSFQISSGRCVLFICRCLPYLSPGQKEQICIIPYQAVMPEFGEACRNAFTERLF